MTPPVATEWTDGTFNVAEAKNISAESASSVLRRRTSDVLTDTGRLT